MTDPDERDVPLKHRRPEACFVYEPARAGVAGRWLLRQRWYISTSDLE